MEKYKSKFNEAKKKEKEIKGIEVVEKINTFFIDNKSNLFINKKKSDNFNDTEIDLFISIKDPFLEMNPDYDDSDELSLRLNRKAHKRLDLLLKPFGWTTEIAEDDRFGMMIMTNDSDSKEDDF